MKLKLQRFWRTSKFIIGLLFIDDIFECFTLENPLREIKIEEKTGIPCGTYPVEFTYSPHFDRVMPLIDSVPGFDSIRIHVGNTVPKDSAGCILVGQSASSNYVSSSWIAFNNLFEKIKDEKNLIITIENI